jgi:hypothetical protein
LLTFYWRFLCLRWTGPAAANLIYLILSKTNNFFKIKNLSE